MIFRLVFLLNITFPHPISFFIWLQNWTPKLTQPKFLCFLFWKLFEGTMTLLVDWYWISLLIFPSVSVTYKQRNRASNILITFHDFLFNSFALKGKETFVISVAHIEFSSFTLNLPQRLHKTPVLITVSVINNIVSYSYI